MKSEKTRLNKASAALMVLALGIGIGTSVPSMARSKTCIDTCTLVLNHCMRTASSTEAQMACFDQNFECLGRCGVDFP